jgi:phage shock protein C
MDRRLFRSRTNRVISGVCGGFSVYFNIDPVIIRVIAVLVVLGSGVVPGLIAYIVLAIIIPLEGTTSSTPKDAIRENVSEMRDTAEGIGQELRQTFSDRDPVNTGPKRTSAKPHSYGTQMIVGVILIVVGALFLLSRFGLFNWLGYLWPLILIVVGLIIIFARKR